MAELTKEYFDKHFEELNDFLGQQFEKVFSTMATKADIADMATKADLAALEQRMTSGFAEQSIKLDFYHFL